MIPFSPEFNPFLQYEFFTEIIQCSRLAIIFRIAIGSHKAIEGIYAGCYSHGLQLMLRLDEVHLFDTHHQIIDRCSYVGIDHVAFFRFELQVRVSW